MIQSPQMAKMRSTGKVTAASGDWIAEAKVRGDQAKGVAADMAREGKGSADMTVPENRQRLKMGEFPEGAAIIPNAFNRISPFTISPNKRSRCHATVVTKYAPDWE